MADALVLVLAGWSGHFNVRHVMAPTTFGTVSHGACLRLGPRGSPGVRLSNDREPERVGDMFPVFVGGPRNAKGARRTKIAAAPRAGQG